MSTSPKGGPSNDHHTSEGGVSTTKAEDDVDSLPELDPLDLVTDLTPAPAPPSIAGSATLAAGRPESPSALDRTIAALPNAVEVRARRLSVAFDAATVNPTHAARLAYELGALHEVTRRDVDTALSWYRRAFGLDPALAANRWALRRLLYGRSAWAELLQVSDVSLGSGGGGTATQAERWLDSALALRLAGRPAGEIRGALEQVRQLAPTNEAVLLALERALADERDSARLHAVWHALAHAAATPVRKTMYWLAVASGSAAADFAGAASALTAAAHAATGSPELYVEVARVRLRLSDAHGTASDVAAALAALADALQDNEDCACLEGELVALRRHQARAARVTRPLDAWAHLQAAFSQRPDHPLLIAELASLAADVGRYNDLVVLVGAWCAAETEAGRRQMMAAWAADSRLGPGRRESSRTFLGAIASRALGYAPLTCSAECDAFADAVHDRDDLVSLYAEAARAAAAGTWIGPGLPSRPEPEAAAALFIQAAELLAFRNTPGDVERARALLAAAHDAAPADPAVLEALLDHEERTGNVDSALARLDSDPTDRACVERALLVALEHERDDTVLELERRLVGLAPDEPTPAWWLAANLALSARDDERRDVATRLAGSDRDVTRSRTAMLMAACLHERGGDPEVALELFGKLRSVAPQDPFILDAYIDMLRTCGRWRELAHERRAQGQLVADSGLARRALREAAWVFEVHLTDPARAAEIYDEWLVRLPDDSAALEGIARCRAAARDPTHEVDARAAIAAMDQTAETQWLYARSLERAGRSGQAIEQYRELTAREEPSVAASNAALALAELASSSANTMLRIAATEALAKRTLEPQLTASLHEEIGWIALIALADLSRAAAAFDAGLALRPDRRGLLLGAALTGSRHGDHRARAERCAALASAIDDAELGAQLLLRAAVLAAAAGDTELASEHVQAARRAGPATPDVWVVAAEQPVVNTAETDPFGAAERSLARAELVGLRSTLVEDPLARAGWQLERAEALEHAGELRDAAAVIADVLDTRPTNRRALAAIRRIARRAGDDLVWAQASYAVGRLSRDPTSQLKLFRNAAGIYERDATPDGRRRVIAIYARIAGIDPSAPEARRLLELLRDGGDSSGLLRTISDQLSHGSTQLAAEERLVPWLLERAALLRDLGRADEAIADLDAVLVHLPDHLEAMLLRADLANAAGDATRAIDLWRRYVATAPTSARRVEVEKLIAGVDSDAVVAPPPPRSPAPRSVSDENSAGGEPTADAAGESDQLDPHDASTVVRDPFGAGTAVADLSALQEDERRVARQSSVPERAVESTVTELYQQSVRRGTHTRTTPTIVEIPSAIHGLADGRTNVTARPSLHVPEISAIESQREVELESQREAEPVLDVRALRFAAEPEALFDNSAAVFMSFEDLQPAQSDTFDETLADYERELASLEAGDEALELRLEAGRLRDLIGDLDGACAHYDAALTIEPGSTSAFRGLRRIARHRGELYEVARLLGAELARAAPRERDSIARHRVDVLLAAGEHDLARVAVGEILDRTPDDTSALLAALELALSDGRLAEVRSTLERLASITDPQLRAAVQCARGVLAARDADTTSAATWFSAAAASDPGSTAMRLEAIRDLAKRGESDEAGIALLELAHQVERDDPVTASALALRAQAWIVSAAARESLIAAVQLAARATPRDALAARIAAETALHLGETELASHAFARWARSKSSSVERAYAAGRAAELDPTRMGRLWARALEAEPDNDYAIAQLRTTYLVSDATEQLAELDRKVAHGSDRETALLRAAASLARDGQFHEGIALLAEARERRPASWALAEALANAFANARQWAEAARVWTELATAPGDYAADIARLHAAVALHRAARTAPTERSRDATLAALGAWDRVLGDDPRSLLAHGAYLALAKRIEDPDVLIKAVSRVHSASRSRWAVASARLRQARLLLTRAPRLALTVVRSAAEEIDDPRCTSTWMLAAAHVGQLAEAVSALEHRAAKVEVARALSAEPALLRLRAAHLALEANDPTRTLELLKRVADKLPGLTEDLRDVARLRAGVTTPETRSRASTDCLSKIVREADALAARGERAVALELYQHALALQPDDPFASNGFVRLADSLRAGAALASFASSRAKAAEARGDRPALGHAFELLARAELYRGDLKAARAALERAVVATPNRYHLVYQLAHAAVADADHALTLQVRYQLLRLGGGAAPAAGDRRALLQDTLTLALAEQRPRDHLLQLARATLEADPQSRLALFVLELLLQGTASEELAHVEQAIAATFDQPEATASFLIRAAEALAALGKASVAIRLFARAAELVPGFTSALDGWLETALRAELWHDVASAALRRAEQSPAPQEASHFYHIAGIALMDRSRAAKAAAAPLRRAIELDPRNGDALLRLRMLESLTDHRG